MLGHSKTTQLLASFGCFELKLDPAKNQTMVGAVAPSPCVLTLSDERSFTGKVAEPDSLHMHQASLIYS